MRLLELPFLEQIEMAKKVARKTNRVSPEEFCKVWNAVAKKKGTVNEVCDQLKMSKSNVMARKTNYQKAGLKFPKLQRMSRAKLDLKALQAILDK